MGLRRGPRQRSAVRAAVPLVLVGLLLGLGAGALRFVTTPAEQEATVTLELSAVSPLLDLTPSALAGRPVAVDTDAQILVSDDIVGPVAAASGRTPQQVRDGLAATARPLTRVLDLHFRTPDRASALAGAERAAETFLEVRERLVLAPTLEFLENVASAPLNTTQRADEPLVDLEGDLSQGQLSQEDRAAALALELPTAGPVLQAPRITAADDRGDPEVPLTSGAALGALVGLGGWWLRRSRSERAGPDRTHDVPVLVGPPAASHRAPAGRRTGRRLPRALSAGLVGLLAAAAAASLTPSLASTQEAEVSLLITPLPGAAFDDRSGNALVDLGTEAQLALSDDVLDRVAPTRGADPTALRQRLSVRLVPNAEVVVVHARAGTGERAASLAERIAEATLDERQQRAAETVRRRNDLVVTRIARTEVDVERAGRAGDLEATKVLSQRLVKLREQLKLLTTSEQSPGSVLGTATVLPPTTAAVRYGLPLAALVAGAALGWWSGRWLGPLLPRRSRRVGHQARGSLVVG